MCEREREEKWHESIEEEEKKASLPKLGFSLAVGLKEWREGVRTRESMDYLSRVSFFLF